MKRKLSVFFQSSDKTGSLRQFDIISIIFSHWLGMNENLIIHVSVFCGALYVLLYFDNIV